MPFQKFERAIKIKRAIEKETVELDSNIYFHSDLVWRMQLMIIKG